MKSNSLLLLALTLQMTMADWQPALASEVKNENKNAGSNQESKFVTELMQKMTPEEKLGQLNLLSVGADVTGPIVSKDVDGKISSGQVGGVFNIYGKDNVRKLQDMALRSRLKIPLIFGFDVIHGHRTIFPIPLALSASWDTDLIERTAACAAAEASGEGLNWTFSPMVDITRDPRWGRVMEGAGEDPYLGSRVAEAMVRGYQGKDNNYDDKSKVMACVKHFALYGAAEAGRDYNTVDMSKVRMYNEYLPPYKAAVDAGVDTVMSSFNEVDGVPATGNKWLMTDLLRKQWGFKGFIATDYTAINEMINHGVGDEAKVAELALNAGIDQDMVGELFVKHGMNLLKDKRVSQEQVDKACYRVLAAKEKLGLFKDPYKYVGESGQNNTPLTKEKYALSAEAANKSLVLLKNDDALPLKKDEKVLFVGAMAKEQRNLTGSWNGAARREDCVTLEAALKSKLGEDNKAIAFAKGANMLEDKALIERLNKEGAELKLDEKSPQALIDEAVGMAQNVDKIVCVLGEPSQMSGEAASRSQIGLFDHQIALLKALKATGKPVVLVLMNGRPLTLSWEDENMNAILETWYAGTAAGTAIVDTLYGDNNPSARLTMSFPRNVGQVPIYYNYKNTGRPYDANEKYKSKYLDVLNSPLYPFGYGLSYSKFEYAPTRAESHFIKDGSDLQVFTTIKNTSDRDGVETAQLYVQDMVGSITRPVRELKGFQKVALKAGESKTVSFTLKKSDLRFYNGDLTLVNEPGDYKVTIAPNAQEGHWTTFTLK